MSNDHSTNDYLKGRGAQLNTANRFLKQTLVTEHIEGLDEELITIDVAEKGERLLKMIRPQYIILKPTLIGGFKNCNAWIRYAENNNTGWWITSALESNIGLNAIAQYCGSLNVSIPQGLGTGALYKNNFEELTEIRKGFLFYK